MIDPDSTFCETAHSSLTQARYVVECTPDWKQGFAYAVQQKPDLIVLSSSLEGASGIALCRQLRHESDVLILMTLPARDVSLAIAGFEAGADDLIAKPVSPGEFLARIRALLRRQARQTHRQIVQCGNLRLDMSTRRAWRGLLEVELTRNEFDLLACLIDQRDTLFSRRHLSEQLWGSDTVTTYRKVDYLIGQLREKIEANPREPKYIRTVRRVGYYLTTPRV